MTFKPKDYNSLSPYFIVKDSTRWAELLAQVFGATAMRSYQRPDGGLMHGELRIDDSVIMYSEATEAYPANEMLMHVYVADVHATWLKAIDAGCEPLQGPVKKDGDSDLRGMFKDFSGNVWAIATQMED